MTDIGDLPIGGEGNRRNRQTESQSGNLGQEPRRYNLMESPTSNSGRLLGTSEGMNRPRPPYLKAWKPERGRRDGGKIIEKAKAGGNIPDTIGCNFTLHPHPDT